MGRSYNRESIERKVKTFDFIDLVLVFGIDWFSMYFQNLSFFFTWEVFNCSCDLFERHTFVLLRNKFF